MKKGEVVLIDWECNSQGDLQEALEANQLEVVTIKWIPGDYEDNPAFAQVLEETLNNCSCLFVVSFNYFPVVSKICEKRKIKYVSWVYDCPHLTLYSKTVFLKCNYLFLFDSILYGEFKSYGLKHVYYLPLAVNTKRLQALFEGKTFQWKNQVSFVGSLYENNFYDQVEYFPEELKGWLDGIMQAQKQVYGYNFLNELLDEVHMKEIRKYVQCGLNEHFFANDSKIFADLFLGQKVTNMERIEVLTELSKILPVTLYSGSQAEKIPGNIKNMGYIDYATEMPVVFWESKINLNISLRSIQAGVPLRVYDILGAGGFVISNYQADFIENGFVAGEDLVVYESKKDLIAKVDYFLSHEEERMEIAENGRRKVAMLHDFHRRVKEILEIMEKDREE